VASSPLLVVVDHPEGVRSYTLAEQDNPAAFVEEDSIPQGVVAASYEERKGIRT